MLSNNKKYKRKTKPLQTNESKRKKPSRDNTMPEAGTNVKMLIDAKGTRENSCFSGLDYDLMATLFKTSDIDEVAKILNDSQNSDSELENPLSELISQNQSDKSKICNVNYQSTCKPILTSIPSKIDSQILEESKENQPEVVKISVKQTNYSQISKRLSESHLSAIILSEFDKQAIGISPEISIIPPSSPSLTTAEPENCNTSLHKNQDVFNQEPLSSKNTPTKVQHQQIDKDFAITIETVTKEDEPSSPSIISQFEPKILNNSATDSDITNCESPFKCVPSTSHILTDNSGQKLTHSPESSPENHEPHDYECESEIDDSDRDLNYEDESEKNYLSGLSSDESPSCQSDSETAPRTRKRKADPAQWKRNRAKALRNSGQQYISLKKGNLVSSRKMGPNCGDSCRLKCSEKFLEHERKLYFDRYWALKDINKQRSFIAKSLQVIQPKYRYPKQNATRKLNNAFYLYKDESKIRVCKKIFVFTLGITNRCIRTVIEKTKDGFLCDDQRGKHDKHVTVPESVKNEARNHIASIPTVESHYTRADTTKNYIEGGRSLMDIYRDYKRECQREHKDFVSFSVFRQIFNYEFNLEFFKPKKDLCQFCESYKNKNDEERLDIEIEYMKHHEEKNLSRSEKEEDKKRISRKFRVACFDLQAALPTPKGEVSTFYYKSKLSTYNFTICELNSKGLGTVNSYLWHEGEGRKGSNEIGSSLLHYLELCAMAPNSERISTGLSFPEVVFYSDNCGGQGKNKYVIAAYLFAVSKLNIKSITHKFLVVGHTQNEGDVSHSLIEKNIKKALKSSPIYLPSQYATLISTARKYGDPFIVHELEHSFFYDLKDLVESTASNFNINDKDEIFNFNDICVIRVEKDHPGVFFYKTSYKDEEFKTVNVTLSRTRRQLKKFQDVQLKKAYINSIAISQRKYRDLMSLVSSNTIPRCHSAFYENLSHD